MPQAVQRHRLRRRTFLEPRANAVVPDRLHGAPSSGTSLTLPSPSRVKDLLSSFMATLRRSRTLQPAQLPLLSLAAGLLTGAACAAAHKNPAAGSAALAPLAACLDTLPVRQRPKTNQLPVLIPMLAAGEAVRPLGAPLVRQSRLPGSRVAGRLTLRPAA